MICSLGCITEWILMLKTCSRLSVNCSEFMWFPSVLLLSFWGMGRGMSSGMLSIYCKFKPFIPQQLKFWWILLKKNHWECLLHDVSLNISFCWLSSSCESFWRSKLAQVSRFVVGAIWCPLIPPCSVYPSVFKVSEMLAYLKLLRSPRT